MWTREITIRLVAPVALSLLLLGGCSSDDPSSLDQEEAELTAFLRANYEIWAMPDEVPYPPDNSPQNAGFAERVELGRLLFYDPILSGDQDVACATCHHAAFAWADARALSVGVGGVDLGPDRARTMAPSDWEFITPRNSPTILDTGYYAPFAGGQPWEGKMFWDGRTVTLEAQSRAPVRSRDEMRHDAYGGPAAVSAVVAKLQAIPEYVTRFEEAFPEDLAALPEGFPIINGNTYGRAIGAYERELKTSDSPYDRFAAGDDVALTLAQKRGMQVFFEKGCVDCHSGPLFSDFEFYALGAKQGGPGRPPVHEHGNDERLDSGRFLEDPSNEAMRFAFRTPPLRNVALTAPYFHAGGEESGGDYQTLHQAVEFFNRGCNDENLEEWRLPDGTAELMMSEDEVDDVVAFLHSLTATRLDSEFTDGHSPVQVPSGLTPPISTLPPALTN